MYILFLTDKEKEKSADMNIGLPHAIVESLIHIFLEP